MKNSLFEHKGGTYTQVGNYLLPNLTLEDTTQKPIGKWGRMRKRYLQEQHPLVFSELLLSEKLWLHLLEIDEACRDRLALLESQMAVHEGVTEALKAADQMEWVRRMNSIRSRAEEFVMQELIYPEKVEEK
jgi:hypothetical protein